MSVSLSVNGQIQDILNTGYPAIEDFFESQFPEFQEDTGSDSYVITEIAVKSFVLLEATWSQVASSSEESSSQFILEETTVVKLDRDLFLYSLLSDKDLKKVVIQNLKTEVGDFSRGSSNRDSKEYQLLYDFLTSSSMDSEGVKKLIDYVKGNEEFKGDLQTNVWLFLEAGLSNNAFLLDDVLTTLESRRISGPCQFMINSVINTQIEKIRAYGNRKSKLQELWSKALTFQLVPLQNKIIEHQKSLSDKIDLRHKETLERVEFSITISNGKVAKMASGFLGK
jgi:hypothetical protein